MPRRARLSVAGIPWHIIQRGNNRSVCFFSEEDYRRYLDELTDLSVRVGRTIHAYVLMTNHVHLLCATITGQIAHARQALSWPESLTVEFVAAYR